MAYVSRSPPIIPDGQISRVRFETLAFFRRPSQVWRGLNAGRIRPRHSGLPPASPPGLSWRCAGFYQAGRHTAKEAAKCPEPLCPTSVLPPLRRCECHLLRERYPSDCLVWLTCHYRWSFRRHLASWGAGCTQSLLPTGSFPTLSLRIFPWMLDPIPRRYTVCSHLFLPRCHRPSPRDWSASRVCPTNYDFS